MGLSILLILVSYFTALLPLEVEPKPISKVTVMGAVFCDTCSNNTFAKHSYFLPGVEVHLECKFKANSTADEDSFSVNRTTNEYGVYMFEFSSFDGFRCKEGHEMGSVCKASLLRSSSSMCSFPGLKISTEHMAIKSKQDNLCIYSLNALNYRPPKRDLASCGAYKGELPSSLNVSEFFLPPFPFGFPPIPYLPPFPPLGFPFPPLPQLPPLPQFPPFPPFPPLPQLPPLPQFPPFPPLPQLPPLPQFPPFPPLPQLPPLPQFPPSPPLPQLPPLPQFPPFPPFPPLPQLPPQPQLPPFPPLPSLPFPFHFPPMSFPTPLGSPFPFPPPLPIPPTPSIFTPSPPPLALSNEPKILVSLYPIIPSTTSI